MHLFNLLCAVHTAMYNEICRLFWYNNNYRSLDISLLSSRIKVNTKFMDSTFIEGIIIIIIIYDDPHHHHYTTAPMIIIIPLSSSASSPSMTIIITGWLSSKEATYLYDYLKQIGDKQVSDVAILR